MPAHSPALLQSTAHRLKGVGERIRSRRKSLKVSAATAAEAASMSRATLHRVESGDPSVTMGAYLNALAALGLAFDIADERAQVSAPASDSKLPAAIRVADYPQLRSAAWQLAADVLLTPEEALGIYERNWRHLDRDAMDEREADLLAALIRGPGKGHLLV